MTRDRTLDPPFNESMGETHICVCCLILGVVALVALMLILGAAVYFAVEAMFGVLA